MNSLKLRHLDIECLFARLLASAAAGVIVGVLAGVITQFLALHFHLQIQPRFELILQIGLGLLTAGIAWPSSRKAFEFYVDLKEVPTVNSPAFQKDRIRVHSMRKEDNGRMQTTSGTSGAANMVTVPLDDGSLKVIITINGLTRREFNNLRTRLDHLSGVKWARPINLSRGKHRLEGTLPASPTRPDTLRKLEELTGNRV